MHFGKGCQFAKKVPTGKKPVDTLVCIHQRRRACCLRSVLRRLSAFLLSEVCMKRFSFSSKLASPEGPATSPISGERGLAGGAEGAGA